MIVIIDYGVGNVLAFVNAFTRLNIPVSVATSAKDLAVATKLILPGVGSFDHAMLRLRQSGMQEPVEKLVQKDAMPVLGICVGMQMLATSSEEGSLPGLGWIEGTVKKFDKANIPNECKLPHMGWNDVKPVGSSPLFSGMEQDSRFYFLHSYYFECANKSNALASTDYGGPFSCAVQKNNVYGVQFHPEKSHSFGSLLLKNFAEL
jgi:imidazole glycerol-phosphate synthase subunit HisH